VRYPFAVDDQSDLARLVEALGLTPHPEGGFYRETYRTEQSTAIYYLLTADTFSEMHRLDADEIYHFYAGDPVEILRLFPDGKSDVKRLGNYLQGGEIPQLLVPKGVWQGSRVCSDGAYALMGTTMTPGFRFEGYEQGKADDLVLHYPEYETLIKQLTRV
jgi:predicted cupin superfamily sugar epimerase